MPSGRKQITFDLDTQQLKKYYPTDSWQNAYYDIRMIMKSNGFEWQQGSTYTSKKGVSSAFATKVIEELTKKLPWINVCMRDCVATNVGRSFSQNYLFDKNMDLPQRGEHRKDTIMEDEIDFEDELEL